MLYRFIDTFNGEEKEKLLSIEKSIFENIKIDVEKETNEVWSGTKIENSSADLKVAQSIFTSFQNYERGAKFFGSFFNFKRF